ncbi:MAG TPA: hypothetical protein VEJ18_07740 [Planctomycetota bacterium]|nr:hypothetical protein [Planctomycetota bacterium]
MEEEKPSRRVVIVEEGSQVLKDLSSRMDPARYRVTTCGTPGEAEGVVRDGHTDLVIMSADRFYEDPDSVRRRLNEWNNLPRVVYLDTEGDCSLLLEPLNADLSDLLANPCSCDEVARAVDALFQEPPESPALLPPEAPAA